MNHFVLKKKNDINKVNDKIKLKDGYAFHQRIKITLFNKDLINYILNKKIKNQFKKIITKIVEVNDSDDDEDGILELLASIDTLRNALINNYSRNISRKEVEYYLLKIGELEGKVNDRKFKKTRHR